MTEMQAAIERQAALCPGCDGAGVPTDDPQVLRCERCGGIFTKQNQPITIDQALKFVWMFAPMQANAGPEGQFMFDLDIMDRLGKRRRMHGWADRNTKRVTQWG